MAETWRVGNWYVSVGSGWLVARRKLLRRRIYPDSRLMAVLRVLMEKPGQLVRTEQILARAWPGRVVTRDSVSSAIYELRQLLGDDAAVPTYIRTEPRRGYRLIATVEPKADSSPRWRLAAVAGVVCTIGLAVAFWAIDASRASEGTLVRVDTLANDTQSAALTPLSDAIDATLLAALIRKNPGRIVVGAEQTASHQLQSRLVACDVAPALVVRLIDTASGHYVWSKTYSLDHASPNQTLVELVASDVTEALSGT